MNIVIMTGRLTRDPMVKTYGDNNDKKMARYTLAVERLGKKEEGQQSADFIGCVCYGGAAEFADRYLRQGTKIIVNGAIQSGQYTNKEGQTIYTTDVIVRNQEFAESKRNDQSNQVAASTTQATAPAKQDTSFMDIPDGAEEQLPWQ